MYVCLHAECAAEIASLFTPAFELAAPDTVVFEAGSLLLIYPDGQVLAEAIRAQCGPDARIAIAPNPDAALLAARNLPGTSILGGDSAAILAPLRIHALPLSPEIEETFDLWGVRTLGDLAGLPEPGIAGRFGEAAVHLQRLSRGSVERPLRIHRRAARYEDRIELDHPITLLDPLLFLLSRILNDLCARLEADGMAASEIHVRLMLEGGIQCDRVLLLPSPLREPKALLKLAQMDLEAHPPQAAIFSAAVYLAPVAPRRLQHGLFLPLAPEPAKLELTLARIRGRVGEHNAGIPELLDTHHPEPFRLVPRQSPSLTSACPPPAAPRLAFRYFRPPVEAEVEMARRRPVIVRAPGVSGKVVRAAGPWRTSGDWWKGTRWDRSEWDLALSNGVLCRLYRENQRWFVEGTYD